MSHSISFWRGWERGRHGSLPVAGNHCSAPTAGGGRAAQSCGCCGHVPRLGVGQSSPGDGGRAIATESRESRAKARASARAGCAAPGRADAAGAADHRRSDGQSSWTH